MAEFVDPVIEELDKQRVQYEFHVLPSYTIQEIRPDGLVKIVRYLTFRLRGNQEFLRTMRSSLPSRIRSLEFITQEPKVTEQDFKGLRGKMGETGWRIAEKQLEVGSRTLLEMFKAHEEGKIDEKQLFHASCFMVHHLEFQIRTTPVGVIQRGLVAPTGLLYLLTSEATSETYQIAF